MSKRCLSLAAAVCLITGCTTGGKVATGVFAVSSAVAVSSFHLNLLCGGVTTDDGVYGGGGCQSNTTAAVFAAIAAAAALTAITFEVVNAVTSEPVRVTTVDPAPGRAAPWESAPESSDPGTNRLMHQAYAASRLGECSTVRVVGTQLAVRDAGYYQTVFQVDPLIARCY